MNIKIIRAKDYATVQTFPLIVDMLKTNFNSIILDCKLPYPKDNIYMVGFSHSK